MKAIKSTENKAIHTHIDLLTIVETLKKNKVSLQEITITLGMFHKDGITPNQSILNKLCTGALKTYKNKGSDFYINSLLQNEQYKNILFSIIPECKREDSSFVFYYYDKDQINLLVLYLYKNNKSKGDIFFLNHSNGQFFESSRLEVDSIYTKNPETYDIFCKEKKLSNINYFNCYKGRQSIEDTKICYATYYSTNAYNSNPKFIIGVLERA